MTRTTGVKTAFLLTGNEVLNGDVLDSNSAYLAKALSPLGLDVECKVIVGDDLGQLVKQLRCLSQEFDFLLVNGGLGATADDLTNQACAQAFGLKLAESAPALEHLKSKARKPIVPGGLIHKQAMLPQGAEVIPNRVGYAVGYLLKVGTCRVVCTPGVPKELMTMTSEEILPLCQREFSLPEPLPTLRLMVFGLGETQMQGMIQKHLPSQLWQGVDLGFRAFAPYCEIKIRPLQPKNTAQAQEAHRQVVGLLGAYAFSQGASLPQVCLDLLLERREWFASAESCTGGGVVQSLVALAGASQVVTAGLVTYANQAKMDLCQVSPVLLEQEGAVSQPVALQMLQGALRAGKAQWGVAVTGIAGPEGGSAEKPLGSVWIAWGSATKANSRLLLIPRPRQDFQELVSATALDLLRREILGLETNAPYYFDHLSRERMEA